MVNLLQIIIYTFVGLGIIQRTRRTRQYQQYYSDSFNYYQKRTRRESSENEESSWERASKAFKIKVEKLKRMTKDEVKRAYWKRAKKVHPDTTGKKSKKFIKLKDAYEFVYAAAV